MAAHNPQNHHGGHFNINGNEEIVESALRVRVMPGSCLSWLPAPPSPPPSPPPKPTHLCKFAVVGDAFGGKTSLVRKMIRRSYVTDGDDGACTSSDDCADRTADFAASVANNSTGTSLGTTATDYYDGSGSTSVEYHKKDIAIWERIDEDRERGNARGENGDKTGAPERKLVCVRVQLWDMNVQHQFIEEQNDDRESNLVRSDSSSVHSTRRAANIAPLLPLLKRIHGFVIVCRCPLPPSSSSRSPNASLASDSPDGTSRADWIELDSLARQIRRWTQCLRDQPSSAGRRPITFVSLACADLAISQYSPTEWAAVTALMRDVCEENGIDSWNMSTSADCGIGGLGIDENHSQNRQSALLRGMLQRQKQVLEDVEDGAESALIDMVSMHLDRTRGVAQPTPKRENQMREHSPHF